MNSLLVKPSATLDPQDELARLIRWQSDKDQAALAPVVQSLQPMLRRLTLRYRGPGVSVDDLMSAGNLGLIEAANRFDTGRGLRFSTYSFFWARAHMRDVARATWQGEVQAGGDEQPTAALDQISSDAPVAEVQVDRRRFERALALAAEGLTERERAVLESRLFDHRPPTLATLGRRLGLSRERVRQIERQTIEHIRKALRRMGVDRDSLMVAWS